MNDYFDSEMESDHFTKKLIPIIILLGILMIVVVVALTAGCITATKDIYRDLTTTPEPTPTQESVVIVETPTPEPTPTLTENQILASTGGHHIGQTVSFDCENASGLKDLTVHTTVYDYKQYNFIHFWSVLWGQYFIESAGEGNQFVFVMVQSYSDEGDTTTWGIQPDQFNLQINNTLYNVTTGIPHELRIKELEETWNRDHVESIKPYGYLWRYGANGAEMAEPLLYLKSGRSNAWDGYLIFAVPREADIDEMKILCNFHNLAPPQYWILK